MSRFIQPKSTPAISEEERMLRDTNAGKLLFTQYREKNCVLLLRNDKLIAASFPEGSKIGAVYLAKVKNVVKNINAYFVEIQNGEICFLPFKDATHPFVLNRKYDGRLLEGDELPVQLVRDAQKTKQASVTAHISLSNDFFALVFGTDHVGYSSNLNKSQKTVLKNILTEENILRGESLSQDYFSVNTAYSLPTIGMIVRTDAAKFLDETLNLSVSESFHELLEEFQLLLRDAVYHSCFSCLRKSKDMISFMLDHFVSSDEYNEMITDNEPLYDDLQSFCNHFLPEKKVHLYKDNFISLNKLYQLDSKLQTAFQERVWLKSGGYLVIQPTEALTVIDVNSGKYEAKRKAEEEYILKLNREAAEEIAIQLRLRNLSGIIIVDFINMESETSRLDIIRYMKLLIGKDKVQTVVVDMTPLGLMEITRKKITKPLYEQFHSDI